MDWDRLRIFHAVAEAGSFTHAGEKLNLSQSAISRQISALEESVRVPLFHRHARGLLLTEQGEMLYRTVKDVFHKLSMAEARLAETKDRPSGPLKVTTTMAFGSTWLTPQIKEFIDLFPEVEVTLLLSDEELDLGMRQADVAIRMSPPRQPDLIQRPLMSVKHLIYGSPDYFARRGKPETPSDLDHHDLVVFGEEAPLPSKTINWLLEVGARPETPRRPILRVNNVYGIYRAVRSGLGLAALPEFMQPEQTKLEPVLTDLDGPVTQAYFVYPEELRHSKRITVFRDFLLRKVAEHNF
ncbi:LysR family transcriptional regulator [Rhodospirillaceae bacterium KN72]|uniref:LysR family transcriptional regulator n=1 Tax=Pacificispira spongiicola TaxID=2729598 RepID=A0A7Y0DYC2_9PROT|nr:LysR family transcriptional regulator [Pacificispira spongiicola]NMM43855.1 LysR family transcriptional regulator [Pacificispira spongiicola]